VPLLGKPGFQWGFVPLESEKVTHKSGVRKGGITMDIGQPRSSLVKLSELDVPLEEGWQDIRNLDVYDAADEQIGIVEDLYVDREARQPSYLVVSAGGLLGVGKKHFLIPVEEVSRDVGEQQRVTVMVPKEKVLNSPEFDLDVGVPAGDLQRAIDAYYGQR